MSDDVKAELQALQRRVDRIYHWAWATGVAAAILGGFGIKLKFDLAEAAELAKQAHITASTAQQMAADAETRLEAKLKDAVDSLSTHAKKLSEQLNADATRHVADAWTAIRATQKFIEDGDSIRLMRGQYRLVVDSKDPKLKDQDIRTGWREAPDPPRTDFRIYRE